MTEVRSNQNNKVIFGICQKAGEHFNIDPVVFRVLFVLLFLFWGIGFWIYLFLGLKHKKKEKN